MKIDCNTGKEKAPCKLRQQFTKCNLLGCEHPLSNHIYYATSEEKLQELLFFFTKHLQFYANIQKDEV